MPDPTIPDLLTRLDGTLDTWAEHSAQQNLLVSGTADGGFTRAGLLAGGPRGYYPVTTADGQTVYRPSIARIEANAGVPSGIERSILEFYADATTTDQQAWEAAASLNLFQPLVLRVPEGMGKGPGGAYNLPQGVTFASRYPLTIYTEGDAKLRFPTAGVGGLRWKPAIVSDTIQAGGSIASNRFEISGFTFVAAAAVPYAVFIDVPWVGSTLSSHGFLRECRFEAENYLDASDPERQLLPGASAGNHYFDNDVRVRNAWRFAVDRCFSYTRANYAGTIPSVGESFVSFEGVCVHCYVRESEAFYSKKGVKARTYRMTGLVGSIVDMANKPLKLAYGGRGFRVVQPGTGAAGMAVFATTVGDTRAGFNMLVDEVTGTFNASAVSIFDENGTVQLGKVNVTSVGRYDQPGESIHVVDCEFVTDLPIDIDWSVDGGGLSYPLSYGLYSTIVGTHGNGKSGGVRLRGVNTMTIEGGLWLTGSGGADASTYRMFDVEDCRGFVLTNVSATCEGATTGAYAGVWLRNCYDFTIVGNNWLQFAKAIRIRSNCNNWTVAFENFQGATADQIECLSPIGYNERFVGLADTSGAGGTSLSHRLPYLRVARNFVGSSFLDVTSEITGATVPSSPLLRLIFQQASTASNAASAQVMQVLGQNGAESIVALFANGQFSTLGRLLATGAAFSRGDQGTLLTVADAGPTTSFPGGRPIEFRFAAPATAPGAGVAQVFSITAAQGNQTLFCVFGDGRVNVSGIRINNDQRIDNSANVPETVLTSNKGSIALVASGESGNGELWFKETGTGSTGWVKVGKSTKVTRYTASGTWAKDPAAKRVQILLYGAGGGGGGGGAGAAGNAISGGGGGGAGGATEDWFDASALPASLSVTIGAGGAGGAAGGDGVAGGFTRVTSGSLWYGSAYGGGGGGSGGVGRASGSGASSGFFATGGSVAGATAGGVNSTSGAVAGVSGATGNFNVSRYGSSGGGSPAAGGTGNAGGASPFASGGGSGGGITSANGYFSGGAGGRARAVLGGNGGVGAAGSDTTPGGAGIDYPTVGDLANAGGGGGGSGSIGGAGGQAGFPSGGGGGGGAGRSAGGVGGTGSGGLAVIVEYF